MGNIIGLSLLPGNAFTAAVQDKKAILIPGKSHSGSRFAAAMEDSAAFFGSPVSQAVAVIPSYETIPRRRELMQEAKQNGLTIRRFISPAIAAALMDHRRKRAFYTVSEHKTVLVGTLIGDIFDAAVMDISTDVAEVIATCAVRSRNASDIRPILQKMMQESAKKPGDIHRLLLIGDAYFESEVQSELCRCADNRAPIGVYTDEDATLGAAILAGVLSGEVDNVLLLDATTHPLSVCAVNGKCVTLIPKNTTIPHQHVVSVTNALDNQTQMEMCLYEGDSPDPNQNTLVGAYYITGLSAAAAKETAQFDVKINLDLCGMVTVSARDASGAERVLAPQPRRAASPQQKTVPPTMPVTAPPVKKPEPPATGAEAAVLAFLPVYDDLLLALEQPSKDPAYQKGIQLTMKKMVHIFREQNVEFYGSRGETFDPVIHEAVMHMESAQYGNNVIVKVLQKGVKVNGKIVRFAKVQVAN